MSNNVTARFVEGGPLRITGKSYRTLLKKYEHQLPEGNFLDDLDIEDGGEITNPDWYGEGSGRSLDVLKIALGATTGKMRIVLVFESGDVLGLIVNEGVVSEGPVSIRVLDPGTEVR